MPKARKSRKAPDRKPTARKKPRPRRVARASVVKERQAEPLQIARENEVREAMARGVIPFDHAGRRIEIPLKSSWGLFQGVYALPEGDLYVVRRSHEQTYLTQVGKNGGGEQRQVFVILMTLLVFI